MNLSQKLTRGWLGARTPTQYLTITARPSKKRIDFEQSNAGFFATNRLDTDVSVLTVQDAEGNLYLFEGIAAGETAKLVPTNKIKAIMAIRTLLSSQEPEFPAGVEIVTSRSYNRRTLSQNLMETELAALTSPLIDGWGDRSYVAITSAGVELDLGLDYANEQNSCHVIRGTW